MLFCFPPENVTSLQKDTYTYACHPSIYYFSVISYTSLQNNLNQPPPQTVRYKGSLMVMLCFFHHIINIITDVTEGSKSATPSNHTHQGFPMIVFDLVQNASGAKGLLSAIKLRIRKNHVRQEPFHDFVGVYCKLGPLKNKKNRRSG